MCRKSHPLYRCEALRKVHINKRVQLVDQWHLCRVCLQSHGQGECRFKGCLRCESQHNLINCPTPAAQVNTLHHHNVSVKEEPTDNTQ